MRGEGRDEGTEKSETVPARQADAGCGDDDGVLGSGDSNVLAVDEPRIKARTVTG